MIVELGNRGFVVTLLFVICLILDQMHDWLGISVFVVFDFLFLKTMLI